MTAALPWYTLPFDHRLDQALPVELTGRALGWLGRYRRYPVFSPRWASGRLRRWGVGLAFLFSLLALAIGLTPGPDLPFAGTAALVLQTLVPVAAGPWLASWVRLQRWSPPREFAGLCAALAAVVLGVAAFNTWGSEPLKQWLSEQTGAVDADGKRKQVQVAVGISIQTPAAGSTQPASGPAVAQPASQRPDRPPTAGAINAVAGGLVTFWLAGGTGLWGWRREREGLAALQRERELAQAQAERREAELKLSVLAAQVEPHFLFNTLAGVRSAITTDPARASEMVDRLVEYLRASIPRLRSDGAAQATLGGQFDTVRAYLGLMTARMPRLQVRVEAAPELLAAHFPPWMLVSLAENAVRHGIEPKVGPARIEVTAHRTPEGGLEVSVADDGVGFGHSESGSGLGLSNVRERLQQLYRGRATLNLRVRPEGGVVATIVLPPDPGPIEATTP